MEAQVPVRSCSLFGNSMGELVCEAPPTDPGSATTGDPTVCDLRVCVSGVCVSGVCVCQVCVCQVCVRVCVCVLSQCHAGLR